jgi:hypothetical protein
MFIKVAYSTFLAWGFSALLGMLYYIVQWVSLQPSSVKWEGAIPVVWLFMVGLPAWSFLLILASEFPNKPWKHFAFVGKLLSFTGITAGLCALLAAA